MGWPRYILIMSTENAITTTSHPSVTPVLKSTTAEDLLDMYESEPAEKAAEVEKEVEKQAKVAEELPKRLIADKIVKDMEALPEAPEVETPEEEVLPEAETKLQEPDRKGVKGKDVEDEIFLPEDALLSVEVDGKVVDVKTADILSAYKTQRQFNANIDRRLNYVDEKERIINSKASDLSAKADRIVEQALKGDFYPLIRSYAAIGAQGSKADPVVLERKALESFENIYKIYSGLNSEQRDTFWLRRKTEHLEGEKTSLLEKGEIEQATKTVESEIDSICGSHGVEKPVFFEFYGKMLENLVGPDKPFKDKLDIEPRHVNEYIGEFVHAKKVYEAIESVVPQLKDDEEFADNVIKYTRSEPGITVQDIEDVIRRTLNTPSKSVENLNRKVERTQSKGLRAQLKGASSDKKAKEKNDVDEDMYQHFFGKRSVSR